MQRWGITDGVIEPTYMNHTAITLNNYDSDWARYSKNIKEKGIPTKFSLRSVHLPFAFWNVALYYIKKHFSGERSEWNTERESSRSWKRTVQQREDNSRLTQPDFLSRHNGHALVFRCYCGEALRSAVPCDMQTRTVTCSLRGFTTNTAPANTGNRS